MSDGPTTYRMNDWCSELLAGPELSEGAVPDLREAGFVVVLTSVDTSKAAINRHVKTGHFGHGG